MFARMLELNFKLENKQSVTNLVRERLLPAFRTQPGFFEFLWLQEENCPARAVAINLWYTKEEAERYDSECIRLKSLLEPLLTATPIDRSYVVDPSFSEALGRAFAF